MEKPHFLAQDPDHGSGHCGILSGICFIYRGRNEPPTKRKTTNQEAAYYTLRGQIQMLSQKEELMAFAFEDRKKSGNTEPILFLV